MNILIIQGYCIVSHTFFPALVLKSDKLNTRTYEYWVNKIELTKTSVTNKREIIYPNVDISFLSFLVGLIDGDGYIQFRKRSNGYIEFNLVLTFNNRDLVTFEYDLKTHNRIIIINEGTTRYSRLNKYKYNFVSVGIAHCFILLKKTQFKSFDQRRRHCSSRVTLECSNNSPTIDPWFLTGFSDAESCFVLSIIKSNNVKVGWVVYPRFQIGLHEKDKALLERIQSYFGTGKIQKMGSQSIQFRVDTAKDLKAIINHFFLKKTNTL